MENENYEEYSFSLADFSKDSSRARNIIIAAVVAVAVLATVFFAFTARGRQWLASGTAIIGKSFSDAVGFQPFGLAPHEIAVSAAAEAPDESLSLVDPAASGSVAQAPFPSLLPPVPTKSAAKKKTIKTIDAKSSAVSPPPVGTLPDITMSFDDRSSASDSFPVFPTAGVPASAVSEASASVQASAPTQTMPSRVSSQVSPSQTYPVTVVIAGDGRGFVTSTPAGIACDGTGTCSWNFHAGQKMALHASHDAASSFGGWAGGCSGAGAQCTVTVDAAMRLTVTFVAKMALASPGGVSASPSPAVIASAPAPPPSFVVPITEPSVLSSVEATSVSGNALATGTVSVSPGSVDHIIIAVVQIGGTVSTNDFVTLRNPTAQTVDMGGWKLRKKSSTGTDASLRIFPSGTILAAGGKLTWANSAGGFSDSIGADIASTQTLAADNSVALFDAGGAMVDAVAWGNGLDQYGEESPFPDDPAAGQSLARRIGSDGGMVDTNDNAKDFILQ